MLAMSTLGSVLSIALAIRQGTSPADLWLVGVLFVATLALAVLFWLHPGPLARLCSGRSAGEVFESPIGPHELQWIALCVLGTYFVVVGVIGFIHYEANLLIVDARFDREQHIADFIGTGLYWLIQIVVGLGLALGARGLTGLLRRLRHGEAPVAADTDLDG